jgi:heat shock protein HtpX
MGTEGSRPPPAREDLSMQGPGGSGFPFEGGFDVNRVKTWVLIAALGGLFVLLGELLFHGTGGLAIGLLFGFGFNLAMYWFSDRIAIKTSRSKPVTESEAPQLYRIVRELSNAKGMPMPHIYVSAMAQPNAFATGRNPEHAAVAVTQGLLQIVDERELRAVLSHELSHVYNHDILIGSIAAGIAMSITFLVRFAFFFGGGRDSRSNPIGPFAMVAAWILAPLAAMVIQLAVTRSREYQADESGAYLSHDPEALASALRKIDAGSRRVPAPASVGPAEAHLFIVNPLTGRNVQFRSLFSTHPPTEARIARLEHIASELGRPFPAAPPQPVGN